MSGQFVPAGQYSLPAKDKGEGARREIGRILGDVGPVFLTNTPLVLLAPAFLLGAAVAGTISGTVQTPPAEAVESAQLALKGALADLKIQQAVRNRVAALAEGWTHHRVVLLPGHGPEVRDTLGRRGRVAEGVETILEISVPTVELKREGRNSANPSLQLSVTVHARMVGAADDVELYYRSFEYRGRERKFTEWGKDDAQAFREELARLPDAVGWRIVYELLCLVPLNSPCDCREATPG